MERKNSQFIITLAIVMAMVCVSCAERRELIPIGQCISICIHRCGNPSGPNYQRCYDDCASGCGGARATESTTTPSDYCNIGCSLHNCAKLSNDAKLLESCLDDCSNVKCKA